MSESLYGHLFRSSALRSDRSGCPDLHIIYENMWRPGKNLPSTNTFFLHKIKPCFIILHKFVPWELFVFLPVFFNLFYFIKTFQSNTICTICICILRQSFVCCCGIKELAFIINTGEINLSYSLSSDSLRLFRI